MFRIHLCRLRPPNPNVLPLNFVLQCRNLLPPEDPNWLPPIDRTAISVHLPAS